MGLAWKEALLRAAGKMSRRRIKGNKARVVLNGANVVMGRAKRGIYGGRHIQFGNLISEDRTKTRRTWKPNVQKKRLYSFALDQFIRVNVTTHALRCIDKAGGIDEYLCNLSDNKMENDLCLFWKRQIQTVNRYLYKIQSGNVPQELHQKLVEDYNERLLGRKWQFPILGNKEDEETRNVAPDVLNLEQESEAEAEGEKERPRHPFKKSRPKRKHIIVFSKVSRLKRKKKAEQDAYYRKLKAGSGASGSGAQQAKLSKDAKAGSGASGSAAQGSKGTMVKNKK